MAEKYEDAKKQSAEYLNQLRRNIKRLKQQKNRFRNKRNRRAVKEINREIGKKQKELKFRKDIYRKTFEEG